MINLSSCASSDLIKVFCRHISATKHKDTHTDSHILIYILIYSCALPLWDMEIHPIQRPFLLHGPLCSLPVPQLNTFSPCSALYVLWRSSCSLYLVSHPFVILFDLWRAQAQAPHSTQRPVPGYSSNMPVNYVIMQSQHAPWAASTCLCHCLCMCVCGSSDIVPIYNKNLFENNNKSGIKSRIIYEYYVSIFI